MAGMAPPSQQPSTSTTKPPNTGLQHPVLDTAVAALLVKAGADAALLVGEKSPPVGLVLTAAQIAQLTDDIVRRLNAFATGRLGEQRESLRSSLVRLFPEEQKKAIDSLVDEEIRREREFLRKMKERVRADIAKALLEPDAEKRRGLVTRILEREQRYLKMREEAMHERSIALTEMIAVEKSSPEGAFWRLSRLVKTHTPDCVAPFSPSSPGR